MESSGGAHRRRGVAFTRRSALGRAPPAGLREEERAAAARGGDHRLSLSLWLVLLQVARGLRNPEGGIRRASCSFPGCW